MYHYIYFIVKALCGFESMKRATKINFTYSLTSYSHRLMKPVCKNKFILQVDFQTFEELVEKQATGGALVIK